MLMYKLQEIGTCISYTFYYTAQKLPFVFKILRFLTLGI